MIDSRLPIIALVLAASLSACGSEDSPSASTPAQGTDAAPSEAPAPTLTDLELTGITASDYCAKLDVSALQDLLPQPTKPMAYTSRMCALSGGASPSDTTIAAISFVPGGDLAKTEAGYRKNQGEGIASLSKITAVPGLAAGDGFMGDSFLGLAVHLRVKDGYVLCSLPQFSNDLGRADLARICVDQVRRLGA